ncbi:MAG: Fe-S protein assembly co-chaperone HscB [Bryobacteraceae bacterium]|nr:Fe-S protein assembly co-chaperone HscB [Bryobacteraceae bacterium]
MTGTPALPADYYAVFGLERRLVLDEAALQKTFYQLSRQFHPDRFAGRPPAEQTHALDFTALLNDGYRVLRDPVRRTEYLLKLEGFDIGEQRSNNVPPELLEEVFELNMMLESAPDRDELEPARTKFLGMQAEADREIAALGRQFDAGGGRDTLSSLRGVLNRRRYIQNLVRDVEKALA